MKSKPLFYKIYFTIIAVFVCVLIVGLIFLYTWLSAFESAQPETLVSNIVSEYLEKDNIIGLKKICELNVSPYENDETVNNAFKNLVKNKNFEISSSSKMKEGYDEVYNIKSDGDTVITFYLKKDKQASYGIKGYKLALAELPEKLYHSYTVNTPSDAIISVNGFELAKEDRKDLQLPDGISKVLGDSKYVSHQTFKLEHFLSEKPEFKAKNADGKECKIEIDKNIVTVSQYISDAETDDIKELAVSASKGYAAYMQNDQSIGNISKYFDTSTDFYTNLKGSMVMFAWDHNGYHFEDVKFSEIHKFNNTLYSCRVSLKQVLINGGTKYTDNFDKYIYINKTDKGLKIIDMQSVG